MATDNDPDQWQAKINFTPIDNVASDFNIPIDRLRSTDPSIATWKATVIRKLNEQMTRHKMAESVERFMAIAAELETRQMASNDNRPPTCN